MTASLSSKITRYGVSESFNLIIESLRDTPGLLDKKFRLADVNKLAQYLVCRNYGKICLELSYLAWAVVNYPTKTIANAPLLEFFWVNESITPARFRQVFEHPHQTENCHICLNKTGLTLTFPKQVFHISPTRVGVLAVLLEVLVTLAPEQLTKMEQRLKGNQNDKAIKSLSSDLQKQLYQFLAEHLTPAQQQRRFRYVSHWLDKNSHEKGIVNTNLLNDDTVLSFWQYAVFDDTSPGYKLYASALFDLIDVYQASLQAKQALALEHAETIGFNSQAGEYSPDFIQKVLSSHSTDTQDYRWLCQKPKFLSKAQWHFIEALVEKNPHSKTLALSFSRLAIFGQWQATLVQAKRKSSTIVQQKLAELPQQNFILYQQKLSTIKQLISQVIMAIDYIFYAHKDSRYLGLSLPLLPPSEAKKIKRWVEGKMNEFTTNASEEISNNINSKLFIQSQTLLMESLELKKALQACKTAFNANNKEGFQQLPTADSLDVYQEGNDGLAHCQQVIKESIEKLAQHWLTPMDCERNYCSDISIFKDIFSLLYGETNEQ